MRTKNMEELDLEAVENVTGGCCGGNKGWGGWGGFTKKQALLGWYNFLQGGPRIVLRMIGRGR